MQAGAGKLNDGSVQLHAGTGRLTAGFATLGAKLNSRDPANPGVLPGTELLASGTSQILTGMDGVPGNPVRPGLISAVAKITEGSSRRAEGTSALNNGIKGDPADPANPGLLKGSQALAAGASELATGNTKLASGSTELASGAEQLANGNARLADGTAILYTSAAAVSPANVAGKSDTAVALGLVAVLVFGSIGTYLVLWNRRRAQPGT